MISKMLFSKEALKTTFIRLIARSWDNQLSLENADENKNDSNGSKIDPKITWYQYLTLGTISTTCCK